MEGEDRALTDNRSAYDDGQLPWLQAVEDEDEPRGVSARKMLAALGLVLAAALLVAATFFWLGRRDTAVNGPPEPVPSVRAVLTNRKARLRPRPPRVPGRRVLFRRAFRRTGTRQPMLVWIWRPIHVGIPFVAKSHDDPAQLV